MSAAKVAASKFKYELVCSLHFYFSTFLCLLLFSFSIYFRFFSSFFPFFSSHISSIYFIKICLEFILSILFLEFVFSNFSKFSIFIEFSYFEFISNFVINFPFSFLGYETRAFCAGSCKYFRNYFWSLSFNGCFWTYRFAHEFR